MLLFRRRLFEPFRRTHYNKKGPTPRERANATSPPSWEREEVSTPRVSEDPEISRELVVLLLDEMIRVYSDAPTPS